MLKHLTDEKQRKMNRKKSETCNELSKKNYLSWYVIVGLRVRRIFLLRITLTA